ncbi:MAG: SEC-C metal-binding domain-containing protein, partial [Prevotella sp.]|nr:SEC-C metal-binding domain-containing protein [Prevotella sp.]
TNKPVIRHDLDDRVYKTAREKYNAVIEEIVEMRNAGRPVLVGTTSVEISELLSRMLNMRNIPHNVLNAKLHQREADIVAQAGRSTLGMTTITDEDGNTHQEERMLGAVTIATNMAGRGTDIKLTPEVKEAGGLAIIGTERHESRRVDRQLRGRSGRQGDPGSSVFYVSFEDKLMRLFAAERISSFMDKLGFKEGDRLEHPYISKSVERAQKKVEENNFGIRKRLLEYDDVMNKQRTVIYEKRHHALIGERIGMDITNTIWDRVINIINNYDYQDCRERFIKVFAMECPFSEEEFNSTPKDELQEKAFQKTIETFKRKMERIQSVAWPIIKQVYENQGQMYERIMVPITDGKKVYNIGCNLKEAYETECKSVVKEFEKAIILHIIDDCWKENLRELDELKHSVQNASYEQKDPLLIFKLESVKIWDNMIDELNNRTTSILMRGQIPEMQQQDVKEAAPEQRSQRYTEQKDDLVDHNQQAAANQDTRETARQQKTQPIIKDKMPGRNDPCPCGSGKKFKNCHGRGL